MWAKRAQQRPTDSRGLASFPLPPPRDDVYLFFPPLRPSLPPPPHSESVTHIVSENNSGDEVLAFVEKQSTVSGERLSAAALVDITWFTDSMGAGRLLEIETRHRLQEILEDGVCQEVESVTQSQRYQTLTLFTSIFGVGVKTAEKWYKEQHQTLADLRASQIRFTKEQQVGLQYYEDLTTPVTRAEADMIRKTVEEAVYRYLPGAVITLAGGFRR
uniref:DNA polymerase mu n=1 Tax=Callorhinchus milii TaxID=7868 RepID=A0A4W3I228_CALMI